MNKEYKFLVVGLGSMGKRRIRCLLAMGYPKEQIGGFDMREDRRKEASEKYDVRTFGDFDEAFAAMTPDGMVISVPPHVHHIYMKEAAQRSVPFFVEASVLDDDMEEIIRLSKKNGIVAAPSATMCFHPAIRMIGDMVNNGDLGKISYVAVHTGQYLPDWHTYEGVEDFYVSRRDTGGAREIVPFELTWLTNMFGFPSRIANINRKTIEINGAEEIDDTYCCIMDYAEQGLVVNLTIDVVSRTPVEKVFVNGDKKQLTWDVQDDMVKVFDPAAKKWVEHDYSTAEEDQGYEFKLDENMYIEELGSFVEAASGGAPFRNTLEADWKVLKLLYAMEESSESGKFVSLQD